MKKLPACDLIAAGFPCQVRQCGKAKGIGGQHSSMVREVFRLMEVTKRSPDWLLLENVPFMLRLDHGRAMTFIAGELRRLGYRWAYRTVDARAFGSPQRRLRVVIIASRSGDPRGVLFADNCPEPPPNQSADAYGFYWTEGSKGLGWGIDCLPTLKGGSGNGIPSPPAIWIPDERRIVTIDIRDAERLQGFPAGWSKPAEQENPGPGTRWRLVGNAVSVRVAAWVGRRLATWYVPGRNRLGHRARWWVASSRVRGRRRGLGSNRFHLAGRVAKTIAFGLSTLPYIAVICSCHRRIPQTGEDESS